MPKKTLLLIIVLTIVTIGLLALAFLPKKPVPQKEVTKVNTESAQTVLTISSLPKKEATPSSYTSDVSIDTGQNKVTAVQLELLYDPNVLTNVDIATGSFFESSIILLKKLDEKNGRITYALSVPPQELGISGLGVLAKISFSLLPSSKGVSTFINFEPKTQVSAEGSSKSVLKSTVGAVFILEIPSVTFSPTPFFQQTGTDSAQ